MCKGILLVPEVCEHSVIRRGCRSSKQPVNVFLEVLREQWTHQGIAPVISPFPWLLLSCNSRHILTKPPQCLLLLFVACFLSQRQILLLKCFFLSQAAAVFVCWLPGCLINVITVLQPCLEHVPAFLFQWLSIIYERSNRPKTFDVPTESTDAFFVQGIFCTAVKLRVGHTTINTIQIQWVD